MCSRFFSLDVEQFVVGTRSRRCNSINSLASGCTMGHAFVYARCPNALHPPQYMLCSISGISPHNGQFTFCFFHIVSENNVCTSSCIVPVVDPHLHPPYRREIALDRSAQPWHACVCPNIPDHDPLLVPCILLPPSLFPICSRQQSFSVDRQPICPESSFSSETDQ